MVPTVPSAIDGEDIGIGTWVWGIQMNIVGVYWECPFCTTYIYIQYLYMVAFFCLKMADSNLWLCSQGNWSKVTPFLGGLTVPSSQFFHHADPVADGMALFCKAEQERQHNYLKDGPYVTSQLRLLMKQKVEMMLMLTIMMILSGNQTWQWNTYPHSFRSCFPRKPRLQRMFNCHV